MFYGKTSNDEEGWAIAAQREKDGYWDQEPDRFPKSEAKSEPVVFKHPENASFTGDEKLEFGPGWLDHNVL